MSMRQPRTALTVFRMHQAVAFVVVVVVAAAVDDDGGGGGGGGDADFVG